MANGPNHSDLVPEINIHVMSDEGTSPKVFLLSMAVRGFREPFKVVTKNATLISHNSRRSRPQLRRKLWRFGIRNETDRPGIQ